MKSNWMPFGWVAMLLGILVALTGPLGCSDDDDDDEGGQTTVVVTNDVTGAVTTNVVAAAEESDEAGNAPAAAALDVTGEWNGIYRNDRVSGHLEMDLRQEGTDVRGQVYIQPNGGPSSIGTVRGAIQGSRMDLTLQEETSFADPVVVPAPRMADPGLPAKAQAEVVLSGQVSADGRSYEGVILGGLPDSTFALQR